MFGQACYFAENFSKADLYAGTYPYQRSRGLPCGVTVASVILGRVFRTTRDCPTWLKPFIRGVVVSPLPLETPSPLTILQNGHGLPVHVAARPKKLCEFDRVRVTKDGAKARDLLQFVPWPLGARKATGDKHWRDARYLVDCRVNRACRHNAGTMSCRFQGSCPLDPVFLRPRRTDGEVP